MSPPGLRRWAERACSTSEFSRQGYSYWQHQHHTGPTFAANPLLCASISLYRKRGGDGSCFPGLALLESCCVDIRCYDVITPVLCPQVGDDGGENVTCTGPHPPTVWHHHAEAQRPEAPRPWGEALQPHGPDVYWVGLRLCHGSNHWLQGRYAGPGVWGEGPGGAVGFLEEPLCDQPRSQRYMEVLLSV